MIIVKSFITDSIICSQLKQEPLSWIMGSDVVVVDPPRKGLDPSLVDALHNLSSIEHKAKSSPKRLDHFL